MLCIVSSRSQCLSLLRVDGEVRVSPKIDHSRKCTDCSTQPITPSIQVIETPRQTAHVDFAGKRIIIECKIFECFGRPCEVQRALKRIFFLRAQQHVPLKFQSLSLLLRDREAHPKRAAAAFAAVFLIGLHL